MKKYNFFIILILCFISPLLKAKVIENKIITKDIPPPCPINDNGYFIDDITEFKNIYIKDKSNNSS